jgi:hypothetical protein
VSKPNNALCVTLMFVDATSKGPHVLRPQTMGGGAINVFVYIARRKHINATGCRSRASKPANRSTKNNTYDAANVRGRNSGRIRRTTADEGGGAKAEQIKTEIITFDRTRTSVAKTTSIRLGSFRYLPLLRTAIFLV